MKRFLAFFCVFIFGVTVHAEEIEGPKQLYAKAAVLMDAESGRVLFGKNEKEALPNASTTKILTCILALEEGDLDDVVTASSYAASQPKVHLGMKEGEQFLLKHLLYSMMLESHNDSAVAIAEHIAGTTKEFAEKMNQKAKQIGCTDTYFITPNGLDAVNEIGIHGTTAADLAKIMSYCVIKSDKKELFLSITGMPEYTFTNEEGSRTFACVNHNSFLNMMEGAISGKTGFTGKAGYCYVGALERDGRTFVVALLASGWPNHKTYKWSDTKVLMEYGLKYYHYRSVETQPELSELKVGDGIAGSGKLFDTAYVKLEIAYPKEGTPDFLVREDEKIELQLEYETNLKAPLKAGEQVGRISYYVEGTEWKCYPVVVSEDVEKRSVAWIFSRIFDYYLQHQGN